MNQTTARVLYIAENLNRHALVDFSVDDKQYDVDIVANSEEAVAALKQQHYDLIAIDANLPFYSGMQVWQAMTSQPLAPPIRIIAPQPSIPLAVGSSSSAAAGKAQPIDPATTWSEDQHNNHFHSLPISPAWPVDIPQSVLARAQTLDELRQHNRNLELLNKVAQLLTSTLDIEEVIEQLVRTITELIDIEGSSVWLLDERQNNDLICAAIFSEGQNITPEQLSLPSGQGIAGWVVQHGQSANVANVASDPRFSSSIDKNTGFNTHSLLAIPLRTPNKVVGVLELVNKRNGQFQESDRALAETLAASAAIAIENARLMQTLRQNSEELQARNEELDAYAHTVAHDLKNPLTMIIGFSDLLRDNFDSLPPENLTLCLEAIVEHGMKMSAIIDTLLKLAGVRGAEQVKLDTVDMGAVLKETMKRIELMLKQHEAIIVEPDIWPPAQGYGPWLEEVWYNYLSNALKYGGIPPKLELGYDQREKDMVRFWVKDNGPGIHLENPDQLFVPALGANTERKRNSHGLGLSIVQRIVRRLGGSVGVESKPGEGSTFYFTLPRSVSRSQ
ncbi:MAG: GAF domain-containing protein [Chloroflexi bacterium]|nr:GAF domain-containing protein [Chloroflexota bacterium]